MAVIIERLIMPVFMAAKGEDLEIKKVTGSDKVRQHLAELGFVVGAFVKVLHEIDGNLIIRVNDSRVALDKSMASRIIVG